MGKELSDLRDKLDALKRQDAYEALAVPADATTPAIKIAWLQACKVYHPVRYARLGPEATAVATEVFCLIKKAYEVLSSPNRPPPRVAPAPRPRPQPQAQARPPARPQPGPVKPPAAPPPKPAPPAYTSSKSMPPEVLQAALAAASTRKQRFAEAEALLARKQYAEAGDILERLAAEDPASSKFHSQLAYARGMVSAAAGNVDDAILQLERCVLHDRTHAEANANLVILRKGSKGLLSRLFKGG